MDEIERIEVIRGAGSALWGANAFSGIVNIITKTPEESDGNSVKVAYGNYWTLDKLRPELFSSLKILVFFAVSNEFVIETGCIYGSDAAFFVFLMTGCRVLGVCFCPFFRPADLPRGLGDLAGVPIC